jgi:hypothetical protein
MRAAQLLGAATANLAVYPLQLAPADEALYHLLTEEVRAQLDDAAFLAAWATGEAMSVEESVAYALGESTPWLSFA